MVHPTATGLCPGPLGGAGSPECPPGRAPAQVHRRRMPGEARCSQTRALPAQGTCTPGLGSGSGSGALAWPKKRATLCMAGVSSQ